MDNKKNGLARFAPALVILGASCWGLIGLFTKQLAAAGCSAVQISFLRCVSAAAILWIILLIGDRSKLKINIRDIWMFLGTGVLSLVFFSVMYFLTQQEAGLSVAAVLLYTAPFFVIIMSAIIFKEKITSKTVLALALAIVGCVFTTGLFSVLISGGVGRVSTIGVLTGIASGFGYALYSIFAHIALKKYSSITVTAYTFLFAALALAPFCLRAELLDMMVKEPSIWQNTLLLAVISTILPYVLYTLGLKYTQPGKASVMAFSEPVVATLTGILVFREQITLGGIIGIALIFVSILLLNLKKKEKVLTN